MKVPFFSVIMPAYNREKFIERSIASVLAQTFTDWELIVVDDCSSDKTPELLAQYTNPRIMAVRNEVNRERSYSRNRGIDLAKGRFICFLDSDDEYKPEHLQTLFEAIEADSEPESKFFFTRCIEVRDGVGEDQFRPDPTGWNPVEYVIENEISTCNIAIPYQILQNEKFDLRWPPIEDLELFTRIAAHLKPVHIPESTVVYYKHEEGSLSLYHDYMGIKVKALSGIRKHPKVKQVLRKPFLQDKLRALRTKHLNFLAYDRRIGAMWVYFVKYIAVDPFNPSNLSIFRDALYFSFKHK